MGPEFASRTIGGIARSFFDDDDSDRAKASRREMLQDLADGRVFAPTHLAEPFGRATPGNNGRRIWRAETNSA